MNKKYFDYASTTPLDPRVLSAMEPYFSEKFGNPSSVHSFGQDAINALDKSRETIAKSIGAKFDEIIFTSSATEANNLAMRGIVSNVKGQVSGVPRLIVSATEHESILETAKDLEKNGAEVIYLPVKKSGLVNLKKLEESLNENTTLVSIMYANNETGAIQDIPKISKIIRDFRDVTLNTKHLTLNDKSDQKSGVRSHRSSVKGQVSGVWPLFHSDATQAFQYLDCDVDKLGVDMMTLSSHKIYGPKGAGALYLRTPNTEHLTLNQKSQGLGVRGQAFSPQLTGGKQEFGLRSGTENVPAIVGFAKAVELAIKLKDKEYKRILELRDYMWKEINNQIPKVKRNNSATKILPNCLNIYLPNIKAEDALIKLDMKGIAVSAGSACAMKSIEPSHVLLAMGFNEKRAENSIRITLGRKTNKTQINQLVKALKQLEK